MDGGCQIKHFDCKIGEGMDVGKKRKVFTFNFVLCIVPNHIIALKIGFSGLNRKSKRINHIISWWELCKNDVENVKGCMRDMWGLVVEIKDTLIWCK